MVFTNTNAYIAKNVTLPSSITSSTPLATWHRDAYVIDGTIHQAWPTTRGARHTHTPPVSDTVASPIPASPLATAGSRTPPSPSTTASQTTLDLETTTSPHVSRTIPSGLPTPTADTTNQVHSTDPYDLPLPRGGEGHRGGGPPRCCGTTTRRAQPQTHSIRNTAYRSSHHIRPAGCVRTHRCDRNRSDKYDVPLAYHVKSRATTASPRHGPFPNYSWFKHHYNVHLQAGDMLCMRGREGSANSAPSHHTPVQSAR